MQVVIIPIPNSKATAEEVAAMVEKVRVGVWMGVGVWVWVCGYGCVGEWVGVECGVQLSLKTAMDDLYCFTSASMHVSFRVSHLVTKAAVSCCLTSPSCTSRVNTRRPRSSGSCWRGLVCAARQTCAPITHQVGAVLAVGKLQRASSMGLVVVCMLTVMARVLHVGACTSVYGDMRHVYRAAQVYPEPCNSNMNSKSDRST